MKIIYGLASAALAGALTLAGGGMAPAYANITWDFSSPTGNLTNTHTYTADGYSIVAKGFANTTTWATTDLYGKHDGGDESGVGINSDPTGEHEIWGTTFIQLDVSDPLAAGFTHYQFQMGSTTQGEAWSVYGSDSTGVGAPLTVLYNKNTDELTPHNLSGFTYYDFFYTGPSSGVGGSNVLLYKDFVASVPEPSTWAMMGLGFAALGFASYRSRKRGVGVA